MDKIIITISNTIGMSVIRMLGNKDGEIGTGLSDMISA